MATKKKSGKWMQKAVKRPGALTRKAKRAHMTTQAFAREHKNDPGLTGKQARLDLTFAKARGKKARKSTSKHSPRPHHKR